MNGILIIDKPPGITSHDVVSRVRRILKTKRVGHTGTLDPFATGVMVILVGQATRLAQFLDKDAKEYEAIVRFGFETDTGDRTGQKRDGETVRHGDAVTRAEIEGVLSPFRGKIEQTPPMYSAKKIDGQKLYELARKGETVERKPVTVTINELEVIDDLKAEDLELGTWDFRLKVNCSAGTYIRTLAEDIGRKIGIGAHLAELHRTHAGKFSIDQSLTLEQLAELEQPASALIPMEQAVSHLQKIELTDERIAKTKNGLSTRILDREFADGEAIQVLDSSEQLVAIGFFDKSENVVQPKVVLV
ncbi:tRNA pseudouridine(55) synthase TruB [soil metagenome]